MSENEDIKKAKEELEKIQSDKYEQRIAELRMKHILDTNSIKADGYEEGLEAGIARGIERGIEQGIKQGISEGEKKAKKQLAKKLLSKGFKIEEVLEITELTKEDLEITD